MTDIDVSPADAIAANEAAQVAAHRAAWISKGYSAEDFDRVVGGAQSKETTEPAPETDPAVDVDANTIPDAVAIRMANKLLHLGVPREKVLAALAEDGIETDVDVRTPEQKDYDKSWGMVEHEPEDYQLDIRGLTREPMDTEQALNAITAGKEFLAALNITPAIGPVVLQRAGEVANKLAAMDDLNKEAWRIEQRAELKRAFKTDNAIQRALDMTAAVFVLSKGTAAHALLRECGAMQDAMLIRLLAAEGERYDAWRKSRPS